MTTRRLWLALRYPPEDHPLFQQVLVTHPERISWIIWGILILLSPLLMLPAIILSGLSYSLFWMVSISRRLTLEKATGRYNLLASSPIGRAGTEWLICTGVMHRSNAFVRLHSLGLWGTRLLLLLFLTTTITSREGDWVVNSLVYMAIGAAFVADHYQTIVTGILIVLCFSRRIKDRFTLSLVAPGALVVVQLFVYIVVALLASVIDTTQRLPALLSIMALLILFVTLREVIIMALESPGLLDWQPDPLIQ